MNKVLRQLITATPPDTVGCNPIELLKFLTSKMESWNDELDESRILPDTVGCNPNKL